MDQQKLRTLVFEKTGVRIDVDDPVFALVALNEAVLAETVERHVALIEQASAGLAAQLDGLEAGGALRRNARNEPAQQPALLQAAPSVAPGPSRAERRTMAIAAGAAVLGALLVLLGQALWFQPPAPPPSTVIARELTPEQALAIRNGEKLGAIVQKLDPKTRKAIEAEMQKP